MAYEKLPEDVETGPEQKTGASVEKKCTRLAFIISGCLLFLIVCVVSVRVFAMKYRSSRLEVMGQPGRVKALNKPDAARYRDSRNMLSGSKVKAAIHLTANPRDRGSEGKLEWLEAISQGDTQSSFQLVNNRIVVPQTGFYFVYSQASFRVSCSEGGKVMGARKRLTPLSHRIYRHTVSYAMPIRLMSSERSVCQEDSFRDGLAVNAINLGAVFLLEKGDTLGTETNHLSEVQIADDQTFFGVFEI